jgi:hypothetical protein
MRQKLTILPYLEASISRLMMSNQHALAAIPPDLICKPAIMAYLSRQQYGFTCEVVGI